MVVGIPEVQNDVSQIRDSVGPAESEFVLAKTLGALIAGGVLCAGGIVERFDVMDYRNRGGETWAPDDRDTALRRFGH